MDECPIVSHSRHQFRGTNRSLPARSRFVGFAEGLGQSAAGCLEHDPEKWEPVFRKDHAQLKCQSANRFLRSWRFAQASCWAASCLRPAAPRLSRTWIGSEERRQLGDQSAAKRALRIGRGGTIHHFPTVDQHPRMIEGAFEVRARVQTLMEKRVAEI